MIVLQILVKLHNMTKSILELKKYLNISLQIRKSVEQTYNLNYFGKEIRNPNGILGTQHLVMRRKSMIILRLTILRNTSLPNTLGLEDMYQINVLQVLYSKLNVGRVSGYFAPHNL